jgi:alginate O-acetyltransferase complex protein AlgI
LVFSDPVFIYFFLPIALILYWAGAWRLRNPYLCVVGSIFYLWGGGAFILLLGATILLNHLAARQLAILRVSNRRAGTALVRVVVALDIGSLGIWKYGGFLVGQVSKLLDSIGIGGRSDFEIALPIAISFFTFQCISYIVDVWRGTDAPAPRLVDFAAYILLFPHLIAGPIVRYSSIEGDLLSVPRRRLDDFSAGAPRFFWGLAKKVLIADQVAAIANLVFALPENRITSSVAWVGVLAYAVQIYFDFSGYSDMAIGLARMFGFSFPENFNRPYSALSVTDFWRRWHISLSSWFRDYVYIPLGGNRGSPVRTYVNLSAIFLLTGIWHGANWTFIVWGGFHGACLVVERLAGLGASESARFMIVRRAVTFVVVCIGWAIFRASDLNQAWWIIKAMVVPSGLDLTVTVEEVLSDQRIVWFAVGLAVVLLPRSTRIGHCISTTVGRRGEALRFAVLASVGPLAAMYAMSSTFSPFLYFKF